MLGSNRLQKFKEIDLCFDSSRFGSGKKDIFDLAQMGFLGL